MFSTRNNLFLLVRVALVCTLAPPSYSQSLTGAITGHVTDTSGGALPGVTVSLSSPSMIGGTRTTVTDGQGLYRFTLLPSGVYVVSFALPGFKTLNIEGVTLNVGSTMTINGQMTVAALEETVTVTSQTPTIDLEAANVAVNWDQQKLNEIPYARSLTGLVSLVPGLYATAYDVGGSRFGTGSGPSARTFGRTGGNVVSYDGMIWDQTYGDYGSYEEAQITTAAKGAEALNPGLTMNLVVKSGSNTWKGLVSANLQDGRFQSNNIDQGLLNRGYAPGDNRFTQLKDFYGEIGGPIQKDRFWFYLGYRDASSGQLIPGFVSLAGGKQVEFFTKLQDPTAKLTYQLTTNNKLEGMAQMGRKWQPYRTADRFNPLEATQNQDSRSLIGPSVKWLAILSQRMTFEAGLQRGGYWWPDTAWSDDVRRTDLTTTNNRGAFLEQNRQPRRWQYNATWTYFADIANRNHELKSGYLGWDNKSWVEQQGYPNQQLYRYRSLAGDTDLFLRPDSVQVSDYPNIVSSGEKYHSWFLNDKITMSRQVTLSLGVRFDRYSSFLPEQGNPGTGPWSTRAIFPARDDFPVYSTFVPRLSVVYDVTGEGRVAFKASYGRYVGGGSGATTNPGPGADDVNPNATYTRTYSNWDGRIPYTPVTANLSSVTGGSTNRTIDPDLRGPFMDEWTAGVDVGLSRTVTVQFSAVKKLDGRGNKRLNLALPFEAYTVVATGVDPGRDNLAGTSDDRPLPVYSVPRSYPTFGQVIERIVQFTDTEGRNRYTAFGVTMNKQLSNRWSLLTAFNADYRHLADLLARDPNEALYGPGDANDTDQGTRTANVFRRNAPEWHYALKISGTRELPWGLTYGSSFVAQSGDWYGREVQVRNALNQTLNIRVEPHAGRYDWVKIWDNRITKRFNLPGGQAIEGTFDLFNTLNVNTVTNQTNRNGVDYLKPTEIIAPRIFRLGVRYRF
jgi:hypothetical protein